MTPGEIVARLNKHRFRYANEEELQTAVAQVLADIPTLQREARLTAASRPDFFIAEDGIIIEIKVKGSFGKVLLQLERYATLEKVRGLVLVTTRSTQAYRMPYMLGGKPLAVCCLYSFL